MSWQNQIDRELQRIAETGPLQQGPVALSVETPHGRLDCELAELDTIACGLNYVRLTTETLASATVDDVRHLGQWLTQRLSYLLEPISNMELDPEGFSLQLRSFPPQQDEDERRYYELTARRGGEIRLCRYASRGRLPATTLYRLKLPSAGFTRHT